MVRSEAYKVLACKVLNWKLREKSDKKLIGNQQTSFPPFYQRIFHKHIRDESPTCMMFSPPTLLSIFPANCPGQSKRCTSKVSSQWRGFFSFFPFSLLTPNAMQWGPALFPSVGKNLSRGQQKVALEYRSERGQL